MSLIRQIKEWRIRKLEEEAADIARTLKVLDENHKFVRAALMEERIALAKQLEFEVKYGDLSPEQAREIIKADRDGFPGMPVGKRSDTSKAIYFWRKLSIESRREQLNRRLAYIQGRLIKLK